MAWFALVSLLVIPLCVAQPSLSRKGCDTTKIQQCVEEAKYPNGTNLKLDTCRAQMKQGTFDCSCLSTLFKCMQPQGDSCWDSVASHFCCSLKQVYPTCTTLTCGAQAKCEKSQPSTGCDQTALTSCVSKAKYPNGTAVDPQKCKAMLAKGSFDCTCSSTVVDCFKQQGPQCWNAKGGNYYCCALQQGFPTCKMGCDDKCSGNNNPNTPPTPPPPSAACDAKTLATCIAKRKDSKGATLDADKCKAALQSGTSDCDCATALLDCLHEQGETCWKEKGAEFACCNLKSLYPTCTSLNCHATCPSGTTPPPPGPASKCDNKAFMTCIGNKKNSQGTKLDASKCAKTLESGTEDCDCSSAVFDCLHEQESCWKERGGEFACCNMAKIMPTCSSLKCYSKCQSTPPNPPVGTCDNTALTTCIATRKNSKGANLDADKCKATLASGTPDCDCFSALFDCLHEQGDACWKARGGELGCCSMAKVMPTCTSLKCYSKCQSTTPPPPPPTGDSCDPVELSSCVGQSKYTNGTLINAEKCKASLKDGANFDCGCVTAVYSCMQKQGDKCYKDQSGEWSCCVMKNAHPTCTSLDCRTATPCQSPPAPVQCDATQFSACAQSELDAAKYKGCVDTKWADCSCKSTLFKCMKAQGDTCWKRGGGHTVCCIAKKGNMCSNPQDVLPCDCGTSVSPPSPIPLTPSGPAPITTPAPAAVTTPSAPIPVLQQCTAIKQCMESKGWKATPFSDQCKAANDQLECVISNDGKCDRDVVDAAINECESAERKCSILECGRLDLPCLNYCQNGGLCSLRQDGTAVCDCPADKTGPVCDSQTSDQCSSSSVDCSGHGTVMVKSTDKTCYCKCTGNWHGVKCNQHDPCTPNPCQHGGTCTVNQFYAAACECSGTWVGKVCDKKPGDLCAGYTCEHNGKCHDQFGEPTCDCADGYWGTHCSNATKPEPSKCDQRALGKCVIFSSHSASIKTDCDRFKAYAECASTNACPNVLKVWCGGLFTKDKTCNIKSCATVKSDCDSYVYQQCYIKMQNTKFDNKCDQEYYFWNCTQLSHCYSLASQLCSTTKCKEVATKCGSGSSLLAQKPFANALQYTMDLTTGTINEQFIKESYGDVNNSPRPHTIVLISMSCALLVAIVAAVVIKKRRQRTEGFAASHLEAML